MNKMIWHLYINIQCNILEEKIEFHSSFPILSNMTLYSSIIASPVWDLIAIASDNSLILLEFHDSWEYANKIQKIEKQFNDTITNNKNLILEKVGQELSEYFSGNRKKFTIPLITHGTEFQKKSWNWLEIIPYGETRNYQEQATQIGHSKAVRAIWWANHNNPIVIIIPCHRVIWKSGKLVWYGGWLDRKIWLLEHEKKNKNT